jgi:hypothetical protein
MVKGYSDASGAVPIFLKARQNTIQEQAGQAILNRYRILTSKKRKTGVWV